MSEWIKRSDREPPQGTAVEIVYDNQPGTIHVVRSPGPYNWTYWRHHVPLPPRTVMVELSEDDARYWNSYSEYTTSHAPSDRFYKACAAALAKGANR